MGAFFIIEDLFVIEEVLTKKDTLIVIIDDEPNDSILSRIKYLYDHDGIFVIIHSFYRFYLLFTYNNSFLMEDKYAPLYLILHGLLSVTSFLFHISNNRVKGRPIIYPEFRLHSIIFAMRSVICTLLFYYKFSNIFNIITCFIVMFLADIVSESNKNKNNKTTMRGMPYDTNISEINKKKIK